LFHHLWLAFDGFGKGGRVNVGLSGNAADIEARASDVSGFKYGYLETMLVSMKGGLIASRACTDDDER
jgi:hypothetical protein